MKTSEELKARVDRLSRELDEIKQELARSDLNQKVIEALTKLIDGFKSGRTRIASYDLSYDSNYHSTKVELISPGGSYTINGPL